MGKQRNRKRNRLKHYDYANPAWYFVTICTDKMKHQFGEIKNEKMILNQFGVIVEKTWDEIPKHYKNIELDYYQIMPNHIHGILIINPVGDGHAHPLQTVIGSFKSAVSKSLHENNNPKFKWQRSFYDRIIRNEKELYNIQKYILQNPLKWEVEKNIDNLDL